jgi:hypothetical protein
VFAKFDVSSRPLVSPTANFLTALTLVLLDKIVDQSIIIKTSIKKQYTKVFEIIDEKVALIPGTQQLQLPKLNVNKSKQTPKIKLPQLNKV